MAANIVLFIHFLLAFFLAANLFLIPLGNYLKWQWVSRRLFRQIHLGLLGFVSIEATLGMTCPLTTLEAELRGTTNQEWFWGFWIDKLLYWNLPGTFFLVLYLVCFSWTVILWFIVPPDKTITVPKKINRP